MIENSQNIVPFDESAVSIPSDLTTDMPKLTNLMKVKQDDAPVSTTSFRKANEDGSVIEIEEDAAEAYKKAVSKLTPEMRDRLYYLHMQDEKLNKTLIKNDYEKNRVKFNKTFVLQNRGTNKIVEIDALSSVHACTLVGWNPKKVVLLEEKMKGT